MQSDQVYYHHGVAATPNNFDGPVQPASYRSPYDTPLCLLPGNTDSVGALMSTLPTSIPQDLWDLYNSSLLSVSPMNLDSIRPNGPSFNPGYISSSGRLAESSDWNATDETHRLLSNYGSQSFDSTMLASNQETEPLAKPGHLISADTDMMENYFGSFEFVTLNPDRRISEATPFLQLHQPYPGSFDAVQVSTQERLLAVQIPTLDSTPALVNTTTYTDHPEIHKAQDFSGLLIKPGPAAGSLCRSFSDAQRPATSSRNCPPLKSAFPDAPKAIKHKPSLSLNSIQSGITSSSFTSVTFSIDRNGMAHAQTTPQVVQQRLSAEDHTALVLAPDSVTYPNKGLYPTDQEPVLVPSRPVSLVASSRHYQPVSCLDYCGGCDLDPDDSEAENESESIHNDFSFVANETDAKNELRRVVSARQSQFQRSEGGSVRVIRRRRSFIAGKLGSSRAVNFSPTDCTQAALRNLVDGVVRRLGCVCGHYGVRENEEFLVQCKSCDMWLHGECINITPTSAPTIYICAFCANTPSARRAVTRNRDPYRNPDRDREQHRWERHRQWDPFCVHPSASLVGSSLSSC